ncbi:unnamed protein product, partial [Mesorhabditis belari]|uniref:JmjC domain-containing protein n=1 Tax=Mesorhabditis belari TaxID=2138241 RepID=A0AAF3F444_9BILA
MPPKNKAPNKGVSSAAKEKEQFGDASLEQEVDDDCEEFDPYELLPEPQPQVKQKQKNGKAKKGNAKKKSTDDEDEDGYMSGDSLNEMNKSKRLNTISKYNFDVILNDPAFDTPEARKLYKEMESEEFTMEYYDSTGIECPLRFNCDPVKLGMKIPSSTLTVDEVMELVDPDLILQVVQVSDQSPKFMTAREWVVYYNTPAEQKKAIYNVLSLEFDQTRLRDLVESPALVRMIDWLQKWPKNRRDIAHKPLNDNTYKIDSTYPKISYYCLMSPNKSYTDFHVDFGGSSVWYHVLRGQKIFWIIEPTETNLCMYEEHLKHQDQTGFFGNVVDRCACVVLKEGETLVIPAGWIHAVYTPADSIVFGGNFLHALAASMQIRIIQSENRVKIAPQYRIPFFEEVHFYAIADFVEKATGRRYARPLLTFTEDTVLAQRHAYFEEQVDNESEKYTSDLAKKRETDLRFFNEIFNHARETIFYDSGAVEKLPEEPLIGATSVHRFPIDAATDGEIGYDENFIQKITPRALAELQVLYDYMYTKLKVQVPEGITRPASLLNCFEQILLYRETDLNRLGTPIPQPIAVYKRRKKQQNKKMPPKKAKNARNVVKSESPMVEEKPKGGKAAKNTPSAAAASSHSIQDDENDFVLPQKLEMKIVIPCEDSEYNELSKALKEQEKLSEALHIELTALEPSEESKDEQPSPELNGVSMVSELAPELESIDQKLDVEQVDEKTPTLTEPEMLRIPVGRIPLKSKKPPTLGGTEAKKEPKKEDDDDDQREKEMKRMLRKRPQHSMNELSDEEDEKLPSDHMAKKRFQDDNRKIVRAPPPRKQKMTKEEEPQREVKQETKDGDAPVETETERSKRFEREKELKKLKKHRPSASFEDALKDPKGKSKSKYKKEEKSLFQNGMPVMAGKELQEARNNIYDFRPLDTITALGKAPLESAYRKSNNNRLNLIKPQTNTHKYKNMTAKDCLLDNVGEESNTVEEEKEAFKSKDEAFDSFAEPLNVSVSGTPAFSVNSPGTPKPSGSRAMSSISSPHESSKRRLSVSSTSSYGTESGFENAKTPEDPPGKLAEKRRPSYLPVLKPTISPIATPASQRFPPVEKKEQRDKEKGKIATQKKSDTTTLTFTLSENPHAYAAERLAQMGSCLMQLSANTKEMAQIDSSSA